MHQDPTLEAVDFEMCQKCVRRYCLANKIVRRRPTHVVAQNIVYDQVVIDNFAAYVCREIAINQYLPSVVVNMDETNISFATTPSYTLEEKGKRTIVTVSGEKLPSLLVYIGKRTRSSRIQREFKNPLSQKHSVHGPRKWLD